jgi:hypothetical protein
MDAQTAVADLQTQLESLLSVVWQAERRWRNEDRIDALLRVRRAAESRHPTPPARHPI